jgi:tape measure domain-containing protein
MSNSLENIGYNLILDDSGFRVTAQSTAAQLKALEAQFASTGQGVKAIEAKINSAGVTFHQWVTSIGAVKFALMDLDSVFLTLPKAVLETAGEIEKLQTVLKGLSTAATDAGRQADAAIGKNFILNLEQNVPFKLQALTDTFVKLKTVGIDPLKGSMESILNEVAKYGGGTEQLKSASLAIQQMAGKGVVSLQELRMQLSQAVPGAAQAMAVGMGMSMGELTKAISKGTVSSEMAIRKMLAVFANDSLGAANEQMKTWQGSLEKLNTRWDLFKMDVADAGMFKAAKDELNDIMNLFGTPQAHQWARGLSDQFVSLIGLFHDGREAITEYLPELITLGKVLLAAFSVTMLSNFISGTRNALTGVVSSYRDYAANAIAAEGAVAAKKISVTEQILAADAKRRESIAMESELRQEALAREIANNQKLIVENDRRNAAIDAARAAEYAKEIENNQQLLAAKLALFEELSAAERTYSATLLAEQYKRAQMGMANNSATAAQYAAQARYTEGLERGLVSMQAEIALLEKESVALMERTNLLRAVTAAEAEATAAQNTLNAATSAQNATLVQKNAALATSIKAEREAVANMSAMTTGAAVLKTGIMGLQFAFNALGGWIGLVSVAVIGGIALWDRYKEHAQQAARAAIVASTVDKAIKQNSVTQGQIDDAKSGIKDKNAQIDILNTQIGMRKAGSDEQGNWIGRKGDDDPEIKAMREKIAALKVEVKNLDNVRAAAQDSFDKSQSKIESHKYAQGLEDADNQALSNISATRAKRVADIQSDFKDRIAQAKGNAKQEEAVQKELSARLHQVEVDTTNDRVKVLEQRRDAINDQIKKGFTGKDAAAQAEAAAQAQERLNQQIDNARNQNQALVAPNDFLSPKGPGKATAPPTDLLAKALARTKTQLDDAKGELRAIVTGATEYAQLRMDAEAKVRDLWENGQLNTRTHGKGATSVRPDFNGAGVQGLIDNETQLKIVQNAKQQMDQLKGRLAPLEKEYSEGMAKLMNGDTTTDAGEEDNSALKFLEKLSSKSLQAANDLAPVIENMKRMKLVADQIDLLNFTRDIVKADQDGQVALIDNTRDRLAAQQALENAAWDRQAAERLGKVRALGGNVEKEEALIESARATRQAQQARDLETPMQKLVREWQDSTAEMEKASTSWANSTIDMIVNASKTGKFEFSDLVQSILLDFEKIQLQKAFGPGLQAGFDSLTNYVSGALGWKSSTAPVTEAGSQNAGLGMGNAAAEASAAAMKLFTGTDDLGEKFAKLAGGTDKFNFTLGDSIAKTATGITVQDATKTSMVTLADAALAAAHALMSISGGSSGGSGILGAIGGVASAALGSYFGGGTVSGALAGTGSMDTGAGSGALFGPSAGTNTLGNWAYGGGKMSNQYGFATGGIMTQFGPAELRKYAQGGIANSPQVAVYGEGSMNEAFVPLPDGKTIPVTISGGGGSSSAPPAVTVNLINQTGTQVNAQQQGSPRFDGKQLILDMVLSAAQSPGTFRDGLRQATR